MVWEGLAKEMASEQRLEEGGLRAVEVSRWREEQVTGPRHLAALGSAFRLL